MSWRAQDSQGALGVLMTLCLTLLLAAGQAPYDWAWSRGHHATPAQWRAHERYEQRGAAHHGPTDSVGAEKRAASQTGTQTGAHVETLAGTWLEDGAHDAHSSAPDGVQARVDAAHQLRPAPVGRRLAPLPAALPSAPSLSPPIQPPRFAS